jgi:hypothetical protein
VAILLACVGVIAWGMWPLGQDELFARGSKLMESESLYDMQRAWTEYLEPLEIRYPQHPYKEKVEAFRLKKDAALTPHHSEAQRFFQLGEAQRQQGNLAAAARTWRSAIDVFEDVEAEKEWVQRCRRALMDLHKDGMKAEGSKNVRAALQRAKELQQNGKRADAERILAGIEQLYRDDPSAAELLLEVQQARQKK